jgi:hypothetical protein
MKDYTNIFKTKRQVISSIKRLIRPLLWKCGYGETVKSKWQPDLIFHFKTAGCNQELYKIPRPIVVTEGFQGFTKDGIIKDMYAGGMATLTFEQLPLEDLIRIETLLERQISFYKELCKKMLNRSKIRK